MIPGFEPETEPLTDYELTLIDPVCAGMKTKKGKDNAITNNRICLRMRAHDFNVTPPRIRKLLNHIRRNRLVKRIIASNKGYWIAQTPKELEEYIKGGRDRAKAILEVMDALQQDLDEWNEYNA